MNPLDLFPTFVRPLWLLGLLTLPLIAWWWRARERRQSVWRQNVDAHLLPHLLQGEGGVRSQRGLWVGLTAAALATIALAGPSWRESPQPLWQTKSPLVIALNLSSASLANDLPPSRLLQARAKIAELLQERAGGQVGLVAYADDAYTVAPLTDDTANVALFLEALSPTIMPVDGDNGARAIEWSQRLLKQAGFKHGDILLLTHGADQETQRAAAAAARNGYRVSALGLGNTLGSAYRQRDGNLAHTQLDAGALRALARAGNGRFAAVTRDTSDLRALKILDPQSADTAAAQGEKRKVRLDQGYLLLPPLLLLALLAFRRGGVLAAVMLCCLWPLLPSPAHAQEQAPAQSQTPASSSPQVTPQPAQAGLWRRADQKAYAHAQEGRAAYRKGDFAAAAQAYARVPGAEGAYNLGNALAKQGQYQQAIDAYDRALRQSPGMPDAVENRKTVLKELQRKPPQGQRQQQNQNQQQKPNQQQNQNQSNQNPQNQNQQNQNQQQNPQNAGQPNPQNPQQQQNQNPPPQNSQQNSPQNPQSQQNPQPPQSQNTQPQNQAQQPADPAAQAKADAAQRERMQRELAKQGAAKTSGEQAAKDPAKETPAERERRIATEAWIKRVPDDPGGLLRAKFQLEYERRRERGER